MKKTKLTLVLLCAAMVFISCNKEKNNSEKNKSAAPQQQNTKAEKKETISSVILYDGTPLYLENDEGKMVYADEALLGDTIRIYMDKNTIEQKEAIRLLSSGKEENFNFIHVSYYNIDYWTRDIFITNDASVTPALITATTIIYNSADGTAATSKKLEEGSIVAVNEASKTTDSDLDIDFVEVTCYNAAAFGNKVWVKSEAVSSNKADILALQTLKKLEGIENPDAAVIDQLSYSLDNLPVSSFVAEKIIAAGL